MFIEFSAGMMRSASEHATPYSNRSGILRHEFSTASIASSGLFTETLLSRRSGRSFSAGPPPKSANHGASQSPRRFASRHVPSAAERLAQAPTLTPIVVSRFDGLMKYLKRNTELQDFQKQVLASPTDVLVPDEYDEVLRGEFARRCSFGERLNTELMHSGKWVKMLKDLGIVSASLDQKDKGPGMITLAEADIIFRRVLHDCDYGGKRMTYDYFCKALCLVASSIYPDLEWEEAMSELMGKMAASVPPEEAPQPDYSLDPNVLLVLDHFKLALHDLFRSFARRSLPGPSDGRKGTGQVRLQEKSFWKHTQDTLSTFGGGRSRILFQGSSEMQDESLNGFKDPDSSPNNLPPLQESLIESETASPEKPPVSTTRSNAEADAGGGGGIADEGPISPKTSQASRESCYSDGAVLQKSNSGKPMLPLSSPTRGGGYSANLSMTTESPKLGSSASASHLVAWAENHGWNSPGKQSSVISSSWGASALGTKNQDTYVYANGSPTIKNRRNYMSLDQMFLLCKELKILPDLIGRAAITKIFKRVQCAGLPSAHSGSNFGFLSEEAFVDAMGQIAIETYAKEPYCDEYPGAHEKIHAFLLDRLPGHSRTMRERFLYGCSGRGPAVSPGFRAVTGGR